MHVHGFRYYDPEIGRYLTRDPIGYGDGLNVYLYVGNNPVNFIDPLGLAGDDGLNEAEQYDTQSQRQETYDRGVAISHVVDQTATEVMNQTPVGAAGNLAYGTPEEKKATATGLALAAGARLAGKAAGRAVRSKPGQRLLGAAKKKLDDLIARFRKGSSGHGTGTIQHSDGSVTRITPDGKIETTPPPAPSFVSPEGSGAADSKLYRGVPGNNTEKARLAKEGIAQPRGTALDEESLRNHVLGEDANAGVTSWTDKREVARRFSGSDGTIIEVDRSAVADRVVPRPDVGKHTDESETLLKDTVQGKPTRP